MIELTDEMREVLSTALMDRAPVIVASAGADGQPFVAFYGTAQVYSRDQLALWARNPEAGFLRRIAENPQVAVLYRNHEKRIGWQFHGRAAINDDPEVRDAVYTAAPEVEQNTDPERRGKAVLIDVARVIQRGQVIMQRD